MICCCSDKTVSKECDSMKIDKDKQVDSSDSEDLDFAKYMGKKRNEKRNTLKSDSENESLNKADPEEKSKISTSDETDSESTKKTLVSIFFFW